MLPALSEVKAGPDFQENITRLPAIDHIEHIDLVDNADFDVGQGISEGGGRGMGRIVSRIENKPGQRGAMAICSYLLPRFGRLDAKAVAHGLPFFGQEYTADARVNPGAHPNIDIFLAIEAGGHPLDIVIVDKP